MIQVPSYAETAVGVSAVECLRIVVYASTDKAPEIPFHIRNFFAQVAARPVSCISFVHGYESIRLLIESGPLNNLDQSNEDTRR